MTPAEELLAVRREREEDALAEVNRLERELGHARAYLKTAKRLTLEAEEALAKEQG